MDNLNITLGQYVKGDSFLHKLDPRFKIVATIILMISIFLIPSSLTNVFFLLGFLGLFLLLLVVCKINLLAVIKGLQPILFIGVFTFVLQILYNTTGDIVTSLNFSFSWVNILVAVAILVLWIFTNKHVPLKMLYVVFMLLGILSAFIFIDTPYDFWNMNFYVTTDGLIKGLFFLLRIVLVVVLSTLLTISTSTTEINSGLQWVLYPLSFIKVPVAEISMMFSLTLRFIPTLLIETSKIMKAQASRGIDFNEGNLFEKVKQVVTLLIPMFFISITRAEDLANAMEARGYIIGEKRTTIDELKFRTRDFISFVVVLALLAMTIVLLVIS